MRHDQVHLAGLGSHRPAAVSCDQAVADGRYQPSRAQASGMLSVMVAGELPAPEMAASAAATAIAEAGSPNGEYGALFHCSTHHQGPAGWSAPHYILNKTLGTPITAIEIRQGCLGVITALRLAADRLSADHTANNILITAADNFGTPGEDRWNSSSLFLLADAAAAVVVSRGHGFATLVSTSSVSNAGMEELHRGGEPMFPLDPNADRGLNFDERTQYWRQQWLEGNPPPTGDLGELARLAVTEALQDAGLRLDQITKVCHVGYTHDALHDLFTDPLDLCPAQTVWELTRRTGHAGAADPLLSLESLWESGQLTLGEHALLACAGPGMEVACAVLTITSPPPVTRRQS